MKKSIVILTLLCVCLMLCACTKTEAEKEITDAVATVNGESIAPEELEYFKGKLKAQILNDYMEKYSIEYVPDFWNRDFDGRTPQQALDEQALEKCVMAKLQFVLMRDKGIYTDISYQGLYNKAIAFNEENSGKEGVVGLKSIKMEQFYSYYLDNGIMELRNVLAKDEIKPTEQEIIDRIAQLKASGEELDENALRSIAASKLIRDKYEAYVAGMRASATVEILGN